MSEIAQEMAEEVVGIADMVLEIRDLLAVLIDLVEYDLLERLDLTPDQLDERLAEVKAFRETMWKQQ